MNTQLKVTGINELIEMARNPVEVRMLASAVQPYASQKTLRRRARLAKQKEKEQQQCK